jgi:hypothetical protein
MTDNEQPNNPASDTVQIDDRRTDELPMDALQTDALRQFMSDAVPYWKTLGLELVEVDPGHAVFQAHVHPGLLQNNVVHGGVLASIADSLVPLPRYRRSSRKATPPPSICKWHT